MAYLEGRLWPTWYRPQKRIPACDLISRVCRRFDVTREEVLGPRRQRVFVSPRAVICRVLRERGLSYPTIGHMMGRRDHTTIMWCVDRFDVYARQDPRVYEIYNEVRDV